MDKNVEQDDRRKSQGQEAEFQERVQKECTCLQCGLTVERVFEVLGSSACQDSKLAGQTQTNQI